MTEHKLKLSHLEKPSTMSHYKTTKQQTAHKIKNYSPTFKTITCRFFSHKFGMWGVPDILN